MNDKALKLSLPSRFMLDQCVDVYLGDYLHDEDEVKILQSLQKRLNDSESNEFTLSDIERELLIDSIHGYWGEYTLDDLELKANEYLIEKLKKKS